MITLYEKLDNKNINSEVIEKAAGILQKGGLVAFPTETVYGLGANGLDSEACRKIYEAKGRPSDNPLILHIGDISQLETIVSDVPKAAEKIINAFWPGPVTIIFNKKDIVPDSVSGGLNTVAVRFPSDEIAKRLIVSSGLPIAAPSANTSGKPSPTKAEHVLHDMDGRIDMIIDGGSCGFGLESTIIDVTGDKPALLRPGAVTKEMLEAVVGDIDVDSAVYKQLSKDEKPKAPGMKYTHYSPEADVALVRGESNEKVIAKINSLVLSDKMAGFKTGVLCCGKNADKYAADIVLSAGDDIETVGARLFDILRRFDLLGAEKVYSEVFDEAGEGMAVMNRLKKAAGHKFIEA
ncbi:L-threonylcarbamoyladenylate synthase [Lachnospiraceae bacterium NSJ-143]|nr:L-threonylcarbamoyladenylate synthase [Lachnospiraceae bacterium NSJ-143]